MRPQEPQKSGWMWVSALCAMYFFGAFFAFYLAALAGSVLLLALVALSWVLDIWLLRFANKRW